MNNTKIVLTSLLLAIVSLISFHLLLTTPASAATMPAESSQYSCSKTASSEECLKNNPIVKWLQWGISILTSLVGIGAVIMLSVAGLQYSAARDNAQGVQAAKQKIYSVLIGLAAYVFLYAFLQWVIPGGVF